MTEGIGGSLATLYILTYADILTKPEIMQMPPFVQ